jgi:hypothetical protein
MVLRDTKLVALVALTAFSQVACYNTYFISKNELAKLESDVEPREVVEVLGDCPGRGTAYRSLELDGTQWAAVEGQAAQASDGSNAASTGGCTSVPVSTANALYVVTNGGGLHRVTPFNFVMSDTQLVSPEYDLLLSLNEVEGAQVKQFSAWKTFGTIGAVSAIAIGTFVGISILTPDSSGFK